MKYIDQLEAIIQALPPFLKDIPWAMSDDGSDYSVYISEEDPFGTMFIAEDISQGPNDGLDLAGYLSLVSPKNVMALIAHIRELEAKELAQ